MSSANAGSSMHALQVSEAEPEVAIQVLERDVTEQLSNLSGMCVVLDEMGGAGAPYRMGSHSDQAKFA